MKLICSGGIKQIPLLLGAIHIDRRLALTEVDEKGAMNRARQLLERI
jgi:hypothetical protein